MRIRNSLHGGTQNQDKPSYGGNVTTHDGTEKLHWEREIGRCAQIRAREKNGREPEATSLRQ